MDTETFINDVLFAPRPKDESWRRPTIYSVTCHAIAALLLPILYWEAAPAPVPPIHVVEINIMGSRDLALKGTGHDFNKGPLEDKTLMSNPGRGRKAKGSSKSAFVAPPAPQQEAPAPPPKLLARGPLFSAAGPGGGKVDAPAGPDKIYAAAGAIRTDATPVQPREATVAAGPGNAFVAPRASRGLIAAGPLFGTSASGSGGSGGGLRVLGGGGGPGGKGRGGGGGGGTGRDGAASGQGGGGPTGVEGSGEGEGSGSALGGGMGSIDGGARLERQGTAIVVDYPVDTGGLSQVTKRGMAVPQASSDFFAISGSLSKRRIIKMKLPTYPRWAEEKGLETSVSVWLAATALGIVEDNLYIAQTSGYPELDRIVLEAVKAIVFAALPDKDSLREDSGIATFNFKLKKNRGNVQ